METQEEMLAETGGTIENKDGKRAYLTFDDGPSENTMELLDVLDECNVKATFFVIGRDESYYDCYKAIVDRGHVLALHSFTHDYNNIYSSKDNFAKDIEELKKLLYDVTGVNAVYYRFPGGSSNSVSKVPMSELIDYVNDQGLIYFDWNALNSDAVSGNLPPEQLVDNIMKDAIKYDDVVILMHDLGNRHTTVESIPLLVDTLRKAGYEILPIDENTPLIRHHIS
ncbi:MAG: polysaccharide deacetylase family protein [Coprococcus sp.]